MNRLLLFGLIGLWAGPVLAGDADIKLTTTNGSTKFTVQNSNALEVSSVTSQGDAYFRSASLNTALTVANGGTGATAAAAALTNLGGQASDATLTALAAYNTNGLIAQTAADT